MKAILTAAVILIAGSAFAQQDNNYSDLLRRYKNPELKKLERPKFDAQRNYRMPQFNMPPSPPQGELLSTLPNGNKVYALPQDNMPCVVPNMEGSVMPNAGSNNRVYRPSDPGAIPNPGAGIILIPTTRKQKAAAKPQSGQSAVNNQ